MQNASPEPEQRRSKGAPRTGTNRRERQTVRILALLRVLSQGGSPTIHELAAEFRTRRETIYRDLRVLQDAGYPITGDERGRLSRPRLLSSSVPEIPFSAAELDALSIAAAQAQIALPDTDSLSSAALKLKALSQSQQNSVSSGLDEIFESWTCGWKDHRSDEDIVTLLIEAMLRKVRCCVNYRRPLGSKAKTYNFDPYRLLFVGGSLYVVGRVPKHDGTATLAIGRLLSVVLSKTTFEIDPTFDPQKCREDAFGISWQDPEEIVLRFRAEQAPYVRERSWHPSQSITELSDGVIELAFRAGGPFEVRRWILGWGDAVEVISPDRLRREMGHVLKSAAGLYGSLLQTESRVLSDASTGTP